MLWRRRCRRSGVLSGSHDCEHKDGAKAECETSESRRSKYFSQWVFLGPALCVPCLVLNPDRSSDKTKSIADLVLKKSLKCEVQLHAAVGEEHECRRRYRGLRHVEKLHA